MAAFLNRWLEQRNGPVFAEKTEEPGLHRYGYGNQVSIKGEKIESDIGAQLEKGEYPLVLLRLGQNQESSLYKTNDVSFDNRNVDQLEITSRLPKKATERKLAVGIPLVGKTGETDEAPMFVVEIDRKKQELTALHLDPGLELEFRDKGGERFIYKVENQKSGQPPTFETYQQDPATKIWSWETVSVPLDKLVINYADQILIRQNQGDQVREISARLFLGTEGSAVHLSQQNISPEAAASREPLPKVIATKENERIRNEAHTTWLNGLRGDRDILRELLKKWDLKPIQTFTGVENSAEYIEATFAGLTPEIRKQMAEDPDVKQRIMITLQEIDWVGTPAVYTGEDGTTLPAKYFESFLGERPDAHLFYWALDAMIRQGEENSASFSWDMTPYMFPSQEEYKIWRKVFEQNKNKLKAFATDLGLPKLADTELMLLALTLRLGIQGKNPYLQGKE